MWNAEIYNRYGKERIQPSIDLVAKIREMKFQRILDAGYGTGMSTVPLVATWENAEIIGIDMSKEMLEKAREILPTVIFIQRDCSKSLLDMGTFDLIFSNAFVQWLPNQEEFISNAFSMLNEEEQKLFMDEVLKNLEVEYSYQANGKILFPFKRLFLVGQK